MSTQQSIQEETRALTLQLTALEGNLNNPSIIEILIKPKPLLLRLSIPTAFIISKNIEIIIPLFLLNLMFPDLMEQVL